MTGRDYLLAGLVAIAVILGLIWSFDARAEDKGSWFKSLMRNDGGGSCCDVSDCKPTNARFVDGHWQAEFAGAMTPIPDAKIIDKESWDGRAYLCALPGYAGRPTIYCFVKPGGQS